MKVLKYLFMCLLLCMGSYIIYVEPPKLIADASIVNMSLTFDEDEGLQPNISVEFKTKPNPTYIFGGILILSGLLGFGFLVDKDISTYKLVKKEN